MGKSCLCARMLNHSCWLQLSSAEQTFPFGPATICVCRSLWCRTPLETSWGWDAHTFSFELCLLPVLVASSNFSWTVWGGGWSCGFFWSLLLCLGLRLGSNPGACKTTASDVCAQSEIHTVVGAFVSHALLVRWLLVHQTTVYPAQWKVLFVCWLGSHLSWREEKHKLVRLFTFLKWTGAMFRNSTAIEDNHCCWVRRADKKGLIQGFYSGSMGGLLRAFEGVSFVFSCFLKWKELAFTVRHHI